LVAYGMKANRKALDASLRYHMNKVCPNGD
jgi:hypothetical protein